MDSAYVEIVSASLVREYLGRKGLQKTLDELNKELPPVSETRPIRTRRHLVKILKIEQLMRRNKELDKSHRTVIEVMARNFMERKDPRMAYSMSKSKKSNHSNHQQKGHMDDLVIEDALEDSETLLGEGKSSIFSKEQCSEAPSYGISYKTKQRGMSGPVTSSLDDTEREYRQRVKYCRPKFPVSGMDSSTTNETEGRSRTSPTNQTKDSVADSLDNQYKSRLEKSLQSLKTARMTAKSTQEQLDYCYSPTSETRDDYRISSHLNKKIEAKKSKKPDFLCDYTPTGHSTAKKQEHLDTNKHIAPTETTENVTRENCAESVDDLEINDVEDLDEDFDDLNLGPRLPVAQSSIVVPSRPIDLNTAVELKTLIFGNANQNFSDEWKYQSFTFCDLPKLQYGIVQKKGGPCGVLACVQACMLQELLFSSKEKRPTSASLEPSRRVRSQALAAALANILWRAGNEKKAVLTLPGTQLYFSGSSRFKADQLTETLLLRDFTTYEDLLTFLRQNIYQFELDGNSSVILTLYSVILSRGISRVRTDMDEPSSTLMGAHGYSTQNMVNLLLCGRATANVFNDVMELDSGDGQLVILKGAPCRSNIGLLSLFEHYKSCLVGTYLKTPKYPIWVVCSESHFSVLFCLKMELLSNWKAERNFDLFYYDGLARQDQEIRLSIRTTSKFFESPSDDDLVPPLEHCIRTKWPEAEVDWNGTEPLL